MGFFIQVKVVNMVDYVFLQQKREGADIMELLG